MVKRSREKPKRLGISKFSVCPDNLTDVNKNSRRYPPSSTIAGGQSGNIERISEMVKRRMIPGCLRFFFRHIKTRLTPRKSIRPIRSIEGNFLKTYFSIVLSFSPHYSSLTLKVMLHETIRHNDY